MHGMDVYSFILDLSPKEVLTGQAWRDDGLLPRSHMPGGGVWHCSEGIGLCAATRNC